MKAILSALIVAVLMATPVLATTNIWTQIQSTGYSKYLEMTSVGGYDYSEHSDQMTANIMQGYENTGTVQFFKGVETPADWILVETTQMAGTGDTFIWKNVDIWTEDTHTIHPEHTVLKYPTEGWVNVYFSTDKPFNDVENWYALVNQPPAQDDNLQQYGTHATFGKMINTDENYQFMQETGINIDPCNFQMPSPPQMPDFCVFCV